MANLYNLKFFTKMKKKLIIGVLAITSILAFAQTSDQSSTDSTERRRFWGWGSSTPEYIDNCQPTGTGQATGEGMCECTAHYTYYVMWIGFDHEEPYHMPCP